ncbi:SHOCT domain-containing protein [Hymenobacter crusticola]|uniref:SHOCT domain-containing protein n=1 Tax=Hymenobacter crusticola TaxID=1770526 RepID=A0A243WJ10_9BACT|nr:SHOCT domain-containing protein [Hymenobacter crusticola]OUJ75260.1 hypothetical protein BXP70_04370 [Hymenobacter crusticola]
MEKDPSPLDTLRQLKEWLDAGTITPAEFETLKQKLVFSQKETPAAPPSPSTTAGPVEDPLMPPVLTEPSTAPSPAASPYFTATPSANPTLGASVGASSYASDVAAPPTESSEEEKDELVAPAPARNPLALALTIGGVLALLALVLYLTLGNQESERLTSTSQTEADSIKVQPEVGPQAQQIDLPPAAAPETVRVAPAIPPVAAPAVDSATTTTTAAAITPATTTPEASANDEAAVRNQVLSALTSYYNDLKEAPFDASQHFASTVERFYTMQNTTPAAINDDLTKTHFPEFLEADTQIDPASVQVGPIADDGTRVVTFLEKGKAFRQSRQQHQQTTAQVRVRFDKNYKIVYLRQERLLENTFTD